MATTLLTGTAFAEVAPVTDSSVNQFLSQFLPPPPPPRRGAPSGRRGAGSRGDCQADPSARTITALVPPEGFGQTTEAHPTIWFHVPYRAEAFHSAAFVLRKADRQSVYRNELSAQEIAAYSSESEWLGLSLPEELEPLAIASSSGEDSLYHWQFVIYCEDPAIDPSASVFVSGSIQRVLISDELLNHLDTVASPLEQATWMAQAGIWFDTLARFSEVGCNETSPEVKAELAIVWQALLTDPKVDLKDLADTSPLRCALPLER